MKELDDFADGGKEITVYGAGNYAHRLIEYMKQKHMAIKQICVSDGEKMRQQSIYDIPVRHISESIEVTDIIVAVNSEHHKAILSAIRKRYPNSRTLVLPDVFFDFALRFLSILPSREYVDFLTKARQIAEKYQRVEFCFYTTMQCFGLMMFFAIRQELEEQNPNVLRVYVPDFYSLYGELDFGKENPGNPYFYKKLKEKYCFLDNQNAAFWKFFLERFPEKATFSDDYLWKGMERFQLSHWKTGNLNHSRKFFSLDEKERREGYKIKDAMGIKQPYVCFNARSDKYFSTKKINNARTQAQSDQRNCSVEKFHRMCEILNQKGYQAVRMGVLNEGEIRGENIVDCGLFPRNPFMDYYLISECEFVVCQYSGFHHMAILFNKPTIITDAINMTVKGDIADTVNSDQDIMLLKKIYAP
ncbi:MAG: TIGR04372 family glycosyltransferase, partial [Selenomonadaceae bacterium]|nr:TIGR04372 family glycosyltransferase [Selenomonadaceae bacterium]